ncbi:MAG: AbrB/MazE/SpoVT family DNA-binding domain-containing protein [Acidobacteria bacterium]|nr:AbrB/MazE/SpoVT family DNA-binding domain-containing protein [Acidobacteriota bacterium]
MEQESSRVTVGPKGRIVIPARLRERAHVTEGSVLYGRVDEAGRLILETRDSIKGRIRAAAKTSAHREGSVVDRLLTERRSEARLAERRVRRGPTARRLDAEPRSPRRR